MSEERKPSLGEFLRSEREKRGLTIEQTSSATKIGLKILRLLEADKYAELPALPFVRGFVRNYGKFLGLDGERLLGDYAGFLDEHSGERPKRDAGHSGYAFERPEGEQSRKVLWGVMAGMLIFGGAVVFLFKPSLKRKHHGAVEKLKAIPSGLPGEVPIQGASPVPTLTGSVMPVGVSSPISGGVPGPAPTPTTLPSPAVTSTATPTPTVSIVPFVPPKVPLVLLPTPTSPVPAPTAVTASAPSAAGSDEDVKQDSLQSGRNYPATEVKYKLVFRTRADVWVRYRCDDKRLMKFALKKDKILVLRGKESIRFQASNSDSITLQINGGPEKVISQSPALFDHEGSPTVVWPLQARDKVGENFKVGTPLPFTPPPESTE